MPEERIADGDIAAADLGCRQFLLGLAAGLGRLLTRAPGSPFMNGSTARQLVASDSST